MRIHTIRISNFKSCYGEHTFNFDNLNGLIKLSGPIGSGKTTLAEALLWGLYGTVKGQNNGQLIAWNTKSCEIELTLTSKNKEVHIVRNIREPLIVEINGKMLNASSKRNTQEILEEEIYDVPKLAVIKMCIISFNQFNSLASMSPGETKQFLDDIFGFKLFTEYNDEIVNERKIQQNERIKLESIYEETIKQIEHLKEKQSSQTIDLKESANVDQLMSTREELVNQGKQLKLDKTNKIKERDDVINEKNVLIKDYIRKMTEASTLGKQAKKHFNTLKSGVCPTCGHKIDESHINKYQNEMLEYADVYRKLETQKQEIEQEKNQIMEQYNPVIQSFDEKMDSLRKRINGLDAELKSYKDSVKLLNDNYDELIREHEEKKDKLKQKLDTCDIEIAQWNEMNELFTKTLRYNLLETLIPHINKSIQFFINRLDQSYKIEYDQEFKAHIYVDSWEKEIAYNNLSTGQRKSLDLAIIFGILQNVIASIDFNVFLLDELMSNMDANARDTMLTLLNDTFIKDGYDQKSIFIINHAEMQDDHFTHKIRVALENKKIKSYQTKDDVVIKCSKYSLIF